MILAHIQQKPQIHLNKFEYFILPIKIFFSELLAFWKVF